MLEVGRVVKAHGLQGDVVVEIYSDRPERSRTGSVFTSGRGSLILESARPFYATGAGRFIFHFEGFEDRSSAESLRGQALRAPALHDPSTLWVHELVGCEVKDTAGSPLGTVAAVIANPASDLLELDSGGLVPVRFVVGRAPGTLTVEIPAGLLD